jgi:heptosyltransferase-3
LQGRGNRALRIIDKYCGIPLVFFLGLFIREKKAPAAGWQAVREPKILLLKTAGIGDTILLSAIAKELKANVPAAAVTLVCTAGNLAMAKCIPEIDEMFVFDLGKPWKSLLGVFRLGRFDLLLDFASWARLNSIIAFFARAALKAGFKRQGMFRHYVYNIRVGHSDAVHELENYRNLLRAVGVESRGCLPGIRVDDAAATSLVGGNGNYVVFHCFPGGYRSYLREWPAARWLELARRIFAQGDFVVLTGGADDAPKAELLARTLRLWDKRCCQLAGKLSLAEVSTVAKNARAVVSVQTGIMHLAAAAGARVVGLHGPTSPLRWGPIGANATAVTPQCGCAPCLSLGFEYKCEDGKCMGTISADTVFAEIYQD